MSVWSLPAVSPESFFRSFQIVQISFHEVGSTHGNFALFVCLNLRAVGSPYLQFYSEHGLADGTGPMMLEVKMVVGNGHHFCQAVTIRNGQTRQFFPLKEDT